MGGGSPQELLLIIDELNGNDQIIRLTFSYDLVALPFLAITIHVKDDKLRMKTFRKETAANTLLLASSHHPKLLIQGIPLGQFLRIRRNCSDMDDFKNESRELYGRFRDRGYSHTSIRRAKKRALWTERGELLAFLWIGNSREYYINSDKDNHPIWSTVGTGQEYS